MSTRLVSPRQLEVLRLAAEGLTVRQTAERMGITIDTVYTHRSRIMERLDADTTTQAVAIAYERGWLARPPCPVCGWRAYGDAPSAHPSVPQSAATGSAVGRDTPMPAETHTGGSA